MRDEFCFLCGKSGMAVPLDRHHIFGGTANRQVSERYGMVLYLCRDCHRKAHTDAETAKQLHVYGQRLWMSATDGDLRDFIKAFGRNYLEDEEWN